MHTRSRKYLIASALGLGAVGSLVIGICVPSTPAHAQLKVFDPGNYSQNILTAARTLEPRWVAWRTSRTPPSRS